LLKRGTTISKSERVIDYNELIRRKLETIAENNENSMFSSEGFISGLNVETVESVVSEDDAADALLATTQEQAEEAANVKVEEIISGANSEAEQIVSEAQEQAQTIRETARQEGYDAGILDAQEEINRQKEQLAVELKEKEVRLQQEYEERKQQLEPELVEVLTEVFRQVTLTVAQDNQDIILHLINGVMKNSETSRDFVIKASPDDYKFLVNNQGKIYCAMSKEVHIDIVEDLSLKRNECIIEADTGVFNCSLDIELNNLIKNIKLLSCLS
jgi:flagellar assembly protein FliH